MDWMALAEKFGVAAAIIAFFLFRDYRREDRMANALDKNSNDVLELSKASVVAQEHIASSISSLAQSNIAIANALMRLPCTEKHHV